MAIIAQDMFNRTSASSFGLASDSVNTWVAYQTQSGFSVNGSEGVVLNTAAGAAQFNHYALGDGVSSSQDLTIRFQLGASGDSFALEGRQKDVNNWYQFNVSTTTMSIIKNVAGTQSSLIGITQAFTAGVYYQARFRIYANQLMARVWLDGNPEPPTWMLSTTDSTFTTGTAGVFLSPTSTTAGIKIDNFLFQDTFINGAPILASDYNNLINPLKPPSGATEKGKYALAGSSYIANGNLNTLVVANGRQSTYVSISVDTADQAASGLSAATPTASAAAGLAYGFQVYDFTTGITTSASCAGNWTIQF